MRKPRQSYDLHIPDDDYKAAYIMERDKLNFESRSIWLYVGADYSNARYAKVGITMGDLASRSYSSANPRYFLFCAFQCYHNTTKEELERIEGDALAYLDDVFKEDNGQTKRARHFESQRLSECYYDINFEEFFACLHDYLWENHIRYFQTCDYVDEGDTDCVYGGVLSWIFNPRVPFNIRRRFLRMIAR